MKRLLGLLAIATCLTFATAEVAPSRAEATIFYHGYGYGGHYRVPNYGYGYGGHYRPAYYGGSVYRSYGLGYGYPAYRSYGYPAYRSYGYTTYRPLGHYGYGTRGWYGHPYRRGGFGLTIGW